MDRGIVEQRNTIDESSVRSNERIQRVTAPRDHGLSISR
jgi:hypothetical protein